MKKETLIIDGNNTEELKKASEILKSGGLVAFPTETVYGLGANALNEEALKKIFEAKGRPQDNPLIVHISELEQLDDLVEEIPLKVFEIMKAFWPGPLTLIMKKKKEISNIITAGLDTIAIRMPSHPVAKELLSMAEVPVAAPSANISGKPSPTDSEHVIEDLSGRVDAIVEGGKTGVGVESTVLDVSGDIPTILRPGGVTEEQLIRFYPNIEVDPYIEGRENMKPKSPGQKYKHYSPKASMKIINGDIDLVVERILSLAKIYKNSGMKVGIMATKETKDKYVEELSIVVGERSNPKTIASNLFDTLRKFDKINVDMILAEGIEKKDIGRAIMNRMEKAAGFDIENL